jgi:hypothetical protein
VSWIAIRFLAICLAVVGTTLGASCAQEESYILNGLLLKKTKQQHEMCDVLKGQPICQKITIPLFYALAKIPGPEAYDVMRGHEECSLLVGHNLSLVCTEGHYREAVDLAIAARERGEGLVTSIAEYIHMSDRISVQPSSHGLTPTQFCSALEAHHQVLAQSEAFAAFHRRTLPQMRWFCPEGWEIFAEGPAP